MKTPPFRTIHGCLVASLFASLVLQTASAQSATGESEAAPVQGAETSPLTAAPADPNTAVAVEVTTDPAGAEASKVVEAVVVESPAAGGAAVVTGEVIQTEPAPAPAKPRYKRDDVRWIQERLAELGYYNGPVDGAYGRITREAIKAYQADQELEQDGRPTPELRDFMWRNGG